MSNHHNPDLLKGQIVTIDEFFADPITPKPSSDRSQATD